ncbi:MAG: IS200/IS605 family transposase [Bacteroidales bacterium]|nr:IS200/IS605 family transposase [Bacteroidales bacterium]
MSYTKLYYHIVIRTYRSGLSINIEHEKELYAYMMGFVNNMNAKLLRIGGMPDHIHLFVSLPATLPVAEFVQKLKVSSSKWLKTNPNFPLFDGWGREYAAFSYCERDKDMIVNYIKKQKEHHMKENFPDEYRKFLTDNGMTINELYFLKD